MRRRTMCCINVIILLLLILLLLHFLRLIFLLFYLSISLCWLSVGRVCWCCYFFFFFFFCISCALNVLHRNPIDRPNDPGPICLHIV